jgi:hypothetical protein
VFYGMGEYAGSYCMCVICSRCSRCAFVPMLLMCYAMVFRPFALRSRPLRVSPPIEVWRPTLVLGGAVGGCTPSLVLGGGRV